MVNAQCQRIIHHLHLQTLLIRRRGKRVGVLRRDDLREEEAEKKMTHE